MADPQPESAAAPPPPTLARSGSLSKLNAQAPEFVPSPRLAITPPLPTTTSTPITAAITAAALPIVQGYGGAANTTPFRVAYGFGQVGFHQQQQQQPHQHQQQQHVNYQHQHRQHHQRNYNQKHQSQEGVGNEKENGNGNNSGAELRNGLSKEACDKIVNQVEYYFSDVNLATTEHLIKFINKDPEGYVPISVVLAFKKIKAAISTISQLAAVLRSSIKLVVSDDGKKVKRLHPLSKSDMEELQARIILAENLPEDCSHQNLMKIFSAVGSVKSIRTCQPQFSNNGGYTASRSSKADNTLYSNKVHAFVEYESIELAEKAVVELNNEGDWRNGLRLRPLHKCSPKPVQARVEKDGNEGEGTNEEDGTFVSEQNQSEKQAEDSSKVSDIHSNENLGEENGGEKESGQRKGRNRGRGGRGRGRGHQHQANRAGAHVGAPLTSNQVNVEPTSNIVKNHPPPGPRMPDGTRGFSMGRGKPPLVNST
ncbi:La-related protein [Drosera capensis]